MRIIQQTHWGTSGLKSRPHLPKTLLIILAILLIIFDTIHPTFNIQISFTLDHGFEASISQSENILFLIPTFSWISTLAPKIGKKPSGFTS